MKSLTLLSAAEADRAALVRKLEANGEAPSVCIAEAEGGGRSGAGWRSWSRLAERGRAVAARRGPPELECTRGSAAELEQQMTGCRVDVVQS